MPENFKICKECKKSVLIRTSGHATESIPHGYCNRKCYLKYKENHPEEFEYSEEKRIRQSNMMKAKIASGEFTPKITNSWTHWNASIALDDGTDKKFRSSWEACFWNCNRHLEYEKFRIPYEIDGKIRTYVADFFDRATNTLYEIKPKSVWPVQDKKMQIIIRYCVNTGIRFIWINDDNILDYISESAFSEQNMSQLIQLYHGLGKKENNKNYENR